ncbi:hypothetical protein JCM4914_73820 [Streptomyces platensis subsp. malvinus]
MAFRTVRGIDQGGEKAHSALDALKAAHAEILTQRTRIGELHGEIRDLQAEWTEEASQRITTENTTPSSESAGSLPTTVPSTNASRPLVPTSVSKTGVWPTSKPASQIRPQRSDPVRLRPADVSGAGHTRAAAPTGTAARGERYG